MQLAAGDCRDHWFSLARELFRRRAARVAARNRPYGDSGYAAVDALVALVIIALAVTLSLVGLRNAKEVADRSAELRQAHALLTYLLTEPETSTFPIEGENTRFTWALKREATDATRPVAICRRTASLHSKSSRHDYSIVTLETCVPEESL